MLLERFQDFSREMASASLRSHAKKQHTRKQVHFHVPSEKNKKLRGMGHTEPGGEANDRQRNRRKWQGHQWCSHNSNISNIQLVEDDCFRQGSVGMQDQLEALCFGTGQVCKLCSSEGDVFEIDVSLLCRHSALAHDLIEDQMDEEIPLPEVKTETLRLLVEFCKCSRHPGILRAQAKLPCNLALGVSCELLWAAKLLNMRELQISVVRMVSQQVEDGQHGEPPFHSLPIGLLHSIAFHGAKCFSQETLCKLISSVAQRATPEHIQSAVEAIVTHLDHNLQEVVIAAVASLQRIGTECAQLALLTHQKYLVRLQALPLLSSASGRTLDVIFQDLQNPCWLFRVTAVQALGRVSQKGDAKVLHELVQKLKDPVREVRNAAVSALRTTVTSDDPETVNGIMDLICHGEWPVQCAALHALLIAAPGNLELLKAAVEQLGTTPATVMKHTATRILRDAQLSKVETSEPCPHDVEVEQERTSPSSAARGLRKPRGPAWCDADSDEEEVPWPMFM